VRKASYFVFVNLFACLLVLSGPGFGFVNIKNNTGKDDIVSVYVDVDPQGRRMLFDWGMRSVDASKVASVGGEALRDEVKEYLSNPGVHTNLRIRIEFHPQGGSVWPGASCNVFTARNLTDFDSLPKTVFVIDKDGTCKEL